VAGPILNPKCEVIPLPFRMDEGEFMATPETLSAEVGKRALYGQKPWSLWTGFGDQALLAYFDCERIIQFDPANRQTWLSGSSGTLGLGKQFGRRLNVGTFVQNTLPVDLWRQNGEAILLGPGWEGYAPEIYWAVARALRRHFDGPAFNSEKDQMVVMALEGMMRSHGRI